MTGQAPAVGEVGPPSARRERDRRRWHRRSLLIGFFRFALPAAIAAIVLSFAAWLALGGLSGRLGQSRGPGPSTIHMSRADFLGRDDQGKAYVLSALEAARDNADSHRISLTAPTLTMDSDGARPTRLTADRGVYREDNRILLLDGHVRVRDAQGDDFATDQAIVDTVKGAVAGKSPIAGHGPLGSIRANAYAVYDRGQRLVFQGGVHARINAH